MYSFTRTRLSGNARQGKTGMRFLFLLLGGGLSALGLIAMPQQNFLHARHLKAAHRVNPIGLEPQNLRLSWNISASGNGVLQTAWQVVVARDSVALLTGKNIAWNSGKKISDQSLQIPYLGGDLVPGATYYWRVRVWDNKGRVSPWSAMARWQMGLPAAGDWYGAKWIAFDSIAEREKIIPAAHGNGKPEWGPLNAIQPVLRKTFNSQKKIKRATLFASGLGHFECRMNGTKVGDHFLDPGWSLYSKEALYVGFDVTAQIKPGVNVIGALVGNGFYHVPAERYRKITGTFGHPKFICRLILEYADGSSDNIVSDSSWKAAPGPIVFSSIFGGEDYDARLEQKGWDRAGFNDQAWQPALVVQGAPHLAASIMEPLKIMQTFNPVKISEPRPGVFVYDFGQNFSGIPALSGAGKIGASVKMIPGENLDAAGMVDQKASGQPAWFTYTFGNGDVKNWQPKFSYYGFRYLQVEGAVPKGTANPQDLPVITALTGMHTRNAAPTVGRFECSNVLFNKIFRLIDWSIKSNMASVLTDCPHREKLGWLEVAHLLGNSVRYNYDIASFYSKIVRDMQLSQTDNGMVPNIAPEWVQFVRDFRDSPEWGSSSVQLPYNLYRWYGDTAVLGRCYEMMKRYVGYLGSKAKDHIVSHGLGDWFDIGPNGSGSGYSVSTPQGITGTAIYYDDLSVLIKTAALLGKTDDVITFKQLAAEVKKAFNNRFFDREKRIYGTGSQTANAMAVYTGLVEPEFKEAVLDNIVQNIRDRNNGLSAGEVGYKYLIAVLEQEGRSDIIFDMNSRSDVPGYGFQLANGATSLMEDWQAKKELGNNHCMLGHFLGWLYSGPGGIRQSDSSIAFKTVVIAPELAGDLTAVKTSYESPYGAIRCEWKKTNRQFELKVILPVNTTGVIELPFGVDKTIWMNGKKNESAYFDRNLRKWVLPIGSGQYSVTVRDPS